MYYVDVVLGGGGHSSLLADDLWRVILSAAVHVFYFVCLMLQIHVSDDIFAADTGG